MLCNTCLYFMPIPKYLSAVSVFILVYSMQLISHQIMLLERPLSKKNLSSLQGLDNLSITPAESLRFLLHFILHIRNLLPSSVSCLPSFRLFHIKSNYHAVQYLTSIKEQAEARVGIQTAARYKEAAIFFCDCPEVTTVILYDTASCQLQLNTGTAGNAETSATADMCVHRHFSFLYDSQWLSREKMRSQGLNVLFTRRNT